jgi:hypothetical protein
MIYNIPTCCSSTTWQLTDSNIQQHLPCTLGNARQCSVLLSLHNLSNVQVLDMATLVKAVTFAISVLTKTLDSFEQVCIGCTIACEKFSLMWTVLDTAAQRPGWRVWKNTAPEHLHFQVQKNPEKSETIETQMSFSLCPTYSFSGRSRLQFSKDLESVQSTWKRELCVCVSVPSF